MSQKEDEVKLQQEAIDLIHQYGSSYKASQAVDIPATTLRDRKAKGEREGLTPNTQPLNEEYADEIPAGQQLAGLSTKIRRADGSIQWVKTKADKEQVEAKALALFEAYGSKLAKLKPVKAPARVLDHLMTVIPFGDPHFGMYSWAEETGQDFDLDIAERDLRSAVRYLVEQSPKSKRCLIVNLGDFFHADNLAGMTARSGNILDMDTRLPKVIRVGVAAMREAIHTALERHETVEVINAIGNHDEVLSMAMSILLANVYENEPRIVIHDQPTRRHYVRHGKVLIGVTHGDRGKKANLPGIMATERPQDWGETVFRTWLVGHKHSDERLEFNGCDVEQFRTLAPGDAWTVAGGWLSKQDMKAIVMHDEYGEVERITCSINLLRDLQNAEATKKN